MYWAGFKALISHWRRHKVQLAGLILGLMLATAFWTGVQAINAQARQSYAQAASLMGQDQLAQIVAIDGQNFPQEEYIALRRAGWQVSPILQGRWRHQDSYVNVMGIDPVTAPPVGPTGLGQMSELVSFITPPGVGMAASQTVARLAGVPGLPALQVSPDVVGGLVLTDIGIAQDLLGAEHQITRLIVVTPGTTPLPEGLRMRPAAQDSELTRLTDSFHLNLTAFGFLSFAVGLLIVHSAVGLGFEQRRVLFRTLRALGLPLRALVVLLLSEVAVIALCAGVFGVVLGYGLAAVLLPDVAATLSGLYGAPVSGGLSLSPVWWLGGIAVALLGALAAAGQSLWRLVRLPVLAPAQPRAWARASARSLWWQFGAACVLMVAALGLAVWGQGLSAGFMTLAALLLGAALVLPGFLYAVTGAAQRLSRGVGAQWFWADTRQQLPGMSLALMALTLALAANIGVGTMVGSFRLVFTGWLDQRLASELYISARTKEEAAHLRSWLQGKVDATLPIWGVEVPLDGVQTQIYGMQDHATYRDHWPILKGDADLWDRLAKGDSTLINEQFARRTGLEPGQTVTLPKGHQLRIVAVYSDYGNPQQQMIIANDLLTDLYPQVSRLRYALRVPPDRVAALADALINEFGLPPAHVSQQDQIKAYSTEVFERTFSVTAALNVLTLGVAAMAILLSLLTLSIIRLPQLAPVWAVGLTRQQLAVLELLRALALAGFSTVLALPVGLLLGWVLLAVVNVAAFGWQLPMTVFPTDWVRLGGLALLAAAVAAAWPAWRLASMSPARLVGVFAHER
ncbi:FtsX family attachment transporter-like protein [Actibacterium atlanticum]|uniref:FtsX family attachment transporter-like protein n=1 Tax=Actibacterium atlanticum TaxID=1461693 RepID=A0A058ZJ68_9RHOB|nr:FtsX-like permease family protein [Actibacterium atlanticum]KCV81240.1 FtsX family attachment transporter-like protein [Actibacterium atlanticum]